MRFTALSSYLMWPYGTGGERATLEILDGLWHAGCDVMIRYAIPAGTPPHALKLLRSLPSRFGFPITHRSDRRLDYAVGEIAVQSVAVAGPPVSWIGTWLDELAPDAIIVQAKDILLLPALGALWKGKVFLLIQEVEALETLSSSLTPAARTRLASSFSMISVSGFLQRRAEHGGFVSSLLYPALAPPAPAGEPDSDGPITSFGTSRRKGADVVTALAHAMPDRRFRVVWGWNETPPPSPRGNLEFAPFLLDPSPYYAQSSLVLVPSRLPEGFGRIAHEGMAVGRVPVVSDRGALPEVVGESGVVVPFLDTADGTPDPRPWTGAIARLMHVNALPSRAAHCRRRAAELTQMARAQFAAVFGIAYPAHRRGEAEPVEVASGTDRGASGSGGGSM